MCDEQTEAEGKAYFDSTNIYAKRLATDWGNAITKSRFQMVRRGLPLMPGRPYPRPSVGSHRIRWISIDGPSNDLVSLQGLPGAWLVKVPICGWCILIPSRLDGSWAIHITQCASQTCALAPTPASAEPYCCAHAMCKCR